MMRLRLIFVFVLVGSFSHSYAQLALPPVWTATHPQTSFGGSVAGAGDVNGDGYSDVIVGAEWYTNGQALEGAAFAYYGSSNGLSATPNWFVEGNGFQVQLGISVAGAGDVNGDGYDDVVVGGANVQGDGGPMGRVYIYYGSASGLDVTPNWSLVSDQAMADLGVSVAGAGDINGDNYSDIVIGAPKHLNDSTVGRVYVYHGSASGLGSQPAAILINTFDDTLFGYSVAFAGDVDGDGFCDVLVSIPPFGLIGSPPSNADRASLYLGSADGIATDASWTVASGGQAVGSAGDVNGDSYDDVISAKTAQGVVEVYHGSATGLSTSPNWTGPSTYGNAPSVSGAGDVNNDGYEDVIIGHYNFGTGGRAYIYLGSASGLMAGAMSTADGPFNGANYGWCVARAGDINTDGLSDVIIGVPRFTGGGSNTPQARVYYGATAPQIIQQPQGQVACAGAVVEHSVVAAGEPTIQYQWLKGATPVVDGGNISGATTPILRFDPVLTSNQGAYACMVKTGLYSIGTFHASITVFPSGSGNMNGVNPVDADDIKGFINAYLSAGPTGPTGSVYCRADMNQDGSVDEDDIPLFIALLLQ